MPSILIIDDDDILRTRLEKAFSNRGYRVYSANGFVSAVERMKATQPDFAVIDLKMPDGTGLDLLDEFRKSSPHTKTVIVTGYGNIANAVEAVKRGAIEYLTKPTDADQILTALQQEVNTPATELQTASLAEAQWEHIQRVLNDCNGNITEAARRLDIPRRTLQRKLKKLAP